MEKTLFDLPIAHSKDPITSYEAGDKMLRYGKLNEQEQLVYEALLANNRPEGHTPYELAALMKGDSQRNYFMIQRRLHGLRQKFKAKRVCKDFSLTCEEKPNRNKLLIRDGCCAWRAIQ